MGKDVQTANLSFTGSAYVSGLRVLSRLPEGRRVAGTTFGLAFDIPKNCI